MVEHSEEHVELQLVSKKKINTRETEEETVSLGQQI